MLNKLMHTINLLGWVYAVAYASYTHMAVQTIASVLVDHLKNVGISI